MTDITGFKRDVVSSYIPKDPGATLTYTIDSSNYLRVVSQLAQSQVIVQLLVTVQKALLVQTIKHM